jgi:PAT family beta-lactamase induction signal transducer AmpG
MPSDAIHRSARDILRVFLSGRMLTALLMGFSSGLPLLLATGSVLQAWLTEAGVDLGTIGLFALVGLPYTLKFLWAPLLDRFAPIVGMGRRRGWLLLIQITLIAAIAGLGLTDPTRSLSLVTLAAFLVSFFSASQDIVIDAYRRESLADDEQGLGASLYVNGYRVGLLISSGGGLILADLIPFSAVYGVMAAAMLPGLITTLLCVEPQVATGRPALCARRWCSRSWSISRARMPA